LVLRAVTPRSRVSICEFPKYRLDRRGPVVRHAGTCWRMATRVRFNQASVRRLLPQKQNHWRQTTLKTRDKEEALRLLAAHNETESQPHLNLALARVYMNDADPHLATRTWQEVMEHIVFKKTDETRRRWEVAIFDKNFDCVRSLAVAVTPMTIQIHTGRPTCYS
jgi:hypothetical protein